MPQYKTHVTLNVFIALPLLLLTGYFWLHPTKNQTLLFAGTFLYTSLFMNPDMDLAHKLKWYSLRGLLSLPFRSYSKIFRHRGLSHSLIFGSLTRVLWLFIWIFLLLYLSNCLCFSQKQLWNYCRHHTSDLLYGFAGIFCADAAHILTDKLSS